VASEELDAELVVYEETRGALHRLNPSATAVFLRVDGTATVADIAADVGRAYGLDPGAISGDVLEILREFGARHLLDGVAGTASTQECLAHGE
jgi:hypothetical protein